jgi:hypothetical protein
MLLLSSFRVSGKFRRHTDGQTFHIVSFARFLELFGVSDDVVREVKKEETVVAPLQAAATPVEREFGVPRATAELAVRSYVSRFNSIVEQDRFPQFVSLTSLTGVEVVLIHAPDAARPYRQIEKFQTRLRRSTIKDVTVMLVTTPQHVKWLGRKLHDKQWPFRLMWGSLEGGEFIPAGESNPA